MQKLLIIKTGDTFPSISAVQGDFERWIISRLNSTSLSPIIADPRKNDSLPDLNQFCGVIISGSHSMVTDTDHWIKIASEWVIQIIEKHIPLLGICFGHQLIAYALNGIVDNNPNGKEFGTVEIFPTKSIISDRLFSSLQFPFKAHVCHTQSVLKLPDTAVRLAFSAMDSNQAFSIGKCVWGVQFHPEFNKFAAMQYIRECRNQLIIDGQNPDELEKCCIETPLSESILRRFEKIILH